MIRDPEELQNSNVWAEAGRPKQIDPSLASVTLAVLGPSGAGKSTVVKVFRTQMDLETKPTIIVDYSFVKKPHTQPSLIHCYEVANESLLDTLDEIVSPQNCRQLHILLCIDASKPKHSFRQLKKWLPLLKSKSELIFAAKSLKYQETFVNGFASRQQKRMEHNDSENLHTLLFPTAVVLCKFDLFDKLAPQVKKWASRAYRFMAHKYGCSVLSCSSKSIEAGALFRNSLGQFLRGDPFASQTEPNKPIIIRRGQDSLSSMNLPYANGGEDLEATSKQLESQLPQDEQSKQESNEEFPCRSPNLEKAIAEKNKAVDAYIQRTRAQ